MTLLTPWLFSESVSSLKKFNYILLRVYIDCFCGVEQLNGGFASVAIIIKAKYAHCDNH